VPRLELRPEREHHVGMLPCLVDDAREPLRRGARLRCQEVPPQAPHVARRTPLLAVASPAREPLVLRSKTPSRHYRRPDAPKDPREARRPPAPAKPCTVCPSTPEAITRLCGTLAAAPCTIAATSPTDMARAARPRVRLPSISASRELSSGLSRRVRYWPRCSSARRAWCARASAKYRSRL